MQSSSSSLLVLWHNAFSLSIMTLCNHRHHHFLFSDTMHSPSPLWLCAIIVIITSCSLTQCILTLHSHIIIIITSCSDTTHYNFKWSPTPSPLILSSWHHCDHHHHHDALWHSLTHNASQLYSDHLHHHDALWHILWHMMHHDFTVTITIIMMHYDTILWHMTLLWPPPLSPAWFEMEQQQLGPRLY